MDTLWPLFLLVLFSNFIEAIAGFGSTILAVTLGAHLFAIDDLLAILVPLNLILSAGILIRAHAHVDWKAFLTRILPFAGAGLPVGIFLFRHIQGSALKTAFGAIVAALSIFELMRIFRAKPIETPSSDLGSRRADLIGVLFLFFGGIMQGMYASGGPFVVYFASRSIRDKSRFRATLSLLWLIMNLILVASLATSHKINAYTLQFSLYLIPAVLVGLFAGSKIHDHVSEKAFRIGVYVLLLMAGISLLMAR